MWKTVDLLTDTKSVSIRFVTCLFPAPFFPWQFHHVHGFNPFFCANTQSQSQSQSQSHSFSLCLSFSEIWCQLAFTFIDATNTLPPPLPSSTSTITITTTPSLHPQHSLNTFSLLTIFEFYYRHWLSFLSPHFDLCVTWKWAKKTTFQMTHLFTRLMHASIHTQMFGTLRWIYIVSPSERSHTM